MNDSCEMRSLVDRHFEGKVRPDEEKELRDHLASCSSCRKHYETLLLRSRIDPQSMDARSRIAIGLGLLPRRKSPMPSLLALSAALAVALILVLILPGTPKPEEGFAARGHDGGQANLLVYRLQPGKPPALAVGEISRSDELAFAYENRTGKKRLLVFGVDPLIMRQRYPVPAAPYGIAGSARLTWVSQTATNTVIGYDLATGIPVEKVRYPTVQQPDLLAFDDAADTLYVVSGSGSGVQVIDSATGTP